MRPSVTRFEIALPPAMGGARCSLEIASENASLADLVPVAQQLTDLAGRQMSELEAEAGRTITCAAGCGACCRQLVVISIPEVFYLARHLAGLPCPRRHELEARFAAVVAALETRGMVDRLLEPELCETAPHVPVAVEYFRLGHACPFLQDESCSIHPYRPVPCRDYSVTSPAEHCRAPYDEPIRKVAMPVALSAPLAFLCAALSGEEPRLVPLPLALRWAEEHAALGRKTWSGQQLLHGLLERIGRQAAPGGTGAAGR